MAKGKIAEVYPSTGEIVAVMVERGANQALAEGVAANLTKAELTGELDEVVGRAMAKLRAAAESECLRPTSERATDTLCEGQEEEATLGGILASLLGGRELNFEHLAVGALHQIADELYVLGCAFGNPTEMPNPEFVRAPLSMVALRARAAAEMSQRFNRVMARDAAAGAADAQRKDQINEAAQMLVKHEGLPMQVALLLLHDVEPPEPSVMAYYGAAREKLQNQPPNASAKPANDVTKSARGRRQ